MLHSITIFVKCFSNFVLGHKLLSLLLVISSIFVPLLTFFYAIIFFSTLDMLSGWWDDAVNNKKKFDKVKFFNYLTRMILFVISLSSIFVLEKYVLCEFGYNSTYLTTVWMALISGFELMSFFHNCFKITKLGIFRQISDKIKNKMNEVTK